MAATVTWEGLRELATFRAENGCAISMYLDLDPSVSPTPDVVHTRVNALLEELANEFDETPGRHDQGGWSQARYQRHIEKLVQDHLRDVAATLQRLLRRLRRPRVVVVASEETRAELEEELSSEVKEAIIGWAAAEAHATPTQLLQTVEPLLERWRAEQEASAVERWREAAGRNGRAASGWAQTLEAASDGRVELLLFHDGTDHRAWECPACDRVAAEAGTCPLDGTQMEENRDGLDLAVHQTLAHGGTVWALRQRNDLDPVEGIGAVLRY